MRIIDGQVFCFVCFCATCVIITFVMHFDTEKQQIRCLEKNEKEKVPVVEDENTMAVSVTDDIFAKPLLKLYVDVTPEVNGKNIFLLEITSKTYIPMKIFCCLESYLRTNPSATVWYLVAATDLDSNTRLRMTRLKKFYPNFMLLSFNTDDVLKQTKMFSLYDSPDFKASPNYKFNVGDLVRYAILHISGGYYSDTDMIMHHTVMDLKNFLVQETSSNVATSLIHLEADHPLLNFVISRLEGFFNKDVWATIGPAIFSKVIREYCNATGLWDPETIVLNLQADVCSLNKDSGFVVPKVISKCPDIQIVEAVGTQVFYWDAGAMFRMTPKSVCLEQIFKKSYGIHMFSHIQQKEHDENSALHVIATRACPKMQEINLQPIDMSEP